jgi:hypothetical protein
VCQRLAKKTQVRPGDKEFRGLIKDEIHKIGQELAIIEEMTEVAKELVDEGGFIDEAFAVKKANLSDELGRTLLRRFLVQTQVVQPLEELLLRCNNKGVMPANLPEVLELALDRVRKLEGIEAKPIKPLDEEWEEHEARLGHYRGKTMIGLRTGMTELDRRTLGLCGLIIFGAKPGAGKTTYCSVAVAAPPGGLLPGLLPNVGVIPSTPALPGSGWLRLPGSDGKVRRQGAVRLPQLQLPPAARQ